MALPAAPSEARSTLAALVVKDGVALGGLPEAQRQLALALAWAGLPEAALTEPDVNARLKALLAAALRCLETDHVELRRWLVDAGWLARDGYGRRYQRVAVDALPPARAAVAALVTGLEPDAFTAACRAGHAAAREARRQAWQARGHHTPPNPPPR
jgi:hypothetical protein